MPVQEWKRGWRALDKQVKVVIPEYWRLGPTFQRALATAIMKGILAWSVGRGAWKHGFERGSGGWVVVRNRQG